MHVKPIRIACISAYIGLCYRAATRWREGGREGERVGGGGWWGGIDGGRGVGGGDSGTQECPYLEFEARSVHI